MKRILFLLLSFYLPFGLQAQVAANTFGTNPVAHNDVTAIAHDVLEGLEEEDDLNTDLEEEIDEMLAVITPETPQWQLQAHRYLLRHYKIIVNVCRDKSRTSAPNTFTSTYANARNLLSDAKMRVMKLTSIVRNNTTHHLLNDQRFAEECVREFARVELAYNDGKKRKGLEDEVVRKAKKSDVIFYCALGTIFTIGAIAILCSRAGFRHRRSGTFYQSSSLAPYNHSTFGHGPEHCHYHHTTFPAAPIVYPTTTYVPVYQSTALPVTSFSGGGGIRSSLYSSHLH